VCSYKVAKHVWNALKIAKVLVARGGTGVAFIQRLLPCCLSLCHLCVVFHPVITSWLLVSMSSVCVHVGVNQEWSH